MTAELTPYKEYRSTGMPWIGEVPKHWGVERAKWLYRKMARPVQSSDEIVTCFRDGIVTLRKNRRLDGFTNSLKEIGYQGVRRGDLVIHAMDAFAGAVGVSDSDGKSTPVYSVCTARMELDSRYYAYLVREMARSQWIMCLARGIRERSTDFRFQAFGAQTVPLPPVEEQRAVADYLDANAAKVRRFIRNRRRLIDVLNEQKQAIINRAVTRGLDSNTSLKPSGVDWLGDIPEHWQVVALRYLATKFGSGVTPRGGATVYQESGVPFLRSQNIHFAGLRLSGVAHIPPELHASLSTTHVRPHDVLLNITGASIGRVCAVPSDFEEGNVNQHVCIIRPRQDEVSAQFLAAYLSSAFMQREIYIEQNGASREGLALDAIRAFKIVVPSLDEQQAIVNSINAATAGLIAACSKAEREIDLIREYRTRLIADVVTGKVDVRHLAPPPGSEDLEEAADELEPLDGTAGELEDEALAGEVAHADD